MRIKEEVKLIGRDVNKFVIRIWKVCRAEIIKWYWKLARKLDEKRNMIKFNKNALNIAYKLFFKSEKWTLTPTFGKSNYDRGAVYQIGSWVGSGWINVIETKHILTMAKRGHILITIYTGDEERSHECYFIATRTKKGLAHARKLYGEGLADRVKKVFVYDAMTRKEKALFEEILSMRE